MGVAEVAARLGEALDTGDLSGVREAIDAVGATPVCGAPARKESRPWRHGTRRP